MGWLYYCGFVWSVSTLGLVCLLVFRLVLLSWLRGLLFVCCFVWVYLLGFGVWISSLGACVAVFVICLRLLFVGGFGGVWGVWLCCFRWLVLWFAVFGLVL